MEKAYFQLVSDPPQLGRSFTATVTNDWNGNITQVGEVIPGTLNATSTFAYDYENRLTGFTIGGSGFSAEHTYDGFNRLVKTDATVGLTTTNYEHVYAGKKHLGNIDVTGTPSNGKVWRWEGGAGAVDNAPIEAPQRSTASGTQFYALNDEKNMQRQSYRVASVTAGDYNDDSRYAEWQQVNGSVVPCRVALGPNLSELFSAYAITLDADRASSAASNHALQLAATDLEYEVTRVKSPVLGRDLNPMGRGDGTYYCNGGNAAPSGSVAIRGAKPGFVGEMAIGFGNGVNNCPGEPPPDWPPPGGKPPECHQVILYPVVCNEFLLPTHPESCCNDDNMWELSYASDSMCKKCCDNYKLTPGAPIPPWHPCYGVCMDWLEKCVYCMKWRKRLDDPKEDKCCRVTKRWFEEYEQDEPCPPENFDVPPMYPLLYCTCHYRVEQVDIERGPCGSAFPDLPGTKYWLSVSRQCIGWSPPGKIYEIEQWWDYRMC